MKHVFISPVTKVIVYTLALLTFFPAAFSATAASDAGEPLQALVQGEELYSRARRMFYNDESEPETIGGSLRTARELFKQLPEGDEKYCHLALVEFLLAEISEAAGKNNEAARAFSTAGDLAQKALEFNEKSSDARRILADTYMRLMEYKGTLYMITKGPQARTLLNKAVQLDPQNYAAYNSLGIYYLNAPAIGGGSLNRGIDTLHLALESDDEFDNFISHIWLGIAFREKNDHEKARAHLQKALVTYSNSSWAKSLLEL